MGSGPWPPSSCQLCPHVLNSTYVSRAARLSTNGTSNPFMVPPTFNSRYIKFYQANAEDMSWLESETFDFINYAYVLHEMPADNAIRVVNEMYRLLKVGGTMNGFEVPFVDNLAARETYVLFNTR